ncbi:MAG: AMP-binding protein [Planctomycetota bacterium]
MHRCWSRIITSTSPYLPQWKQVLYGVARWRRTRKIRFGDRAKRSNFWDAIEQSSGRLSPAEIIPSKDPAYILSTGGTTGAPKAVTLSHRNIVANAWQQVHWIGGTSQSEHTQETMLAVLPFFHSYGMSTMLASGIALGAKLVMQPRFSVSSALKAISTQDPTIFHAVPAMLAAMNQRLRIHRGRNPFDLSSLKWVISGGAALPAEVGSEFAHHSGAQVVEGYGLSEASPVTHVGPLDGSNQLGTIGLPLPNTECRIVDLNDPNKDLSSGEVGELLIRAPQVMLGYWENEQATAQILQNGWLRTGDLARRNARGFYQIVDRKKDLIITSGFNVYPADVEQVLRECDDVADVAIIGVPDASRGEIVKAFVVLNKGVRWNKSKLERFCKSRLAKHRRPKLWEHVKDDLPRNFLGKVIRRELRLSQDGSQ